MKKILFVLFITLSLPLAADSEWDQAALELEQQAEITVYRSPDCQCCHKWIQHLEKHNFNVADEVTHNLSEIKHQSGIPKVMGSCHTAMIDGYLIEGHVPADDIKRLLLQQPAIKGLSVPQMPVGTPGMEMGPRKDNFTVISFDEAGNYRIFNRYTVGSDQLYQSVPPED
ncbi:DUF411 domain-containing protein [Methylophaga sp.]|uniref:DUF411 domain-containing protein n=1 Tax=Methylophaga sp. TaxID=2024840 RepID=UPI003F6A2E2E